MEIKATSSDAYRLFHEGTLAFGRAEKQGIRVDIEYCENKKKHLTRKIERMELQLKKSKFYKDWQNCTKGPVNMNSNPQLSYYLYDVLKLKPVHETKSGKGATDEEALMQLNIPELTMMLNVRKLRKIRDTYLDGFLREQVDGVIHPSFNLHLVRTFRSSSDRPNFQNIPKRDEEAMLLTRRALFPRRGYQLAEVDFSGIEVRIAACYHKDPVMLKYINDPTTDMHSDMSSQLFILTDFDKSNHTHKFLRSATKNGFVFPQFYGDYYKNCAMSLATTWCKLPEDGRWKTGQGVALNDGHIADHLIANKIKSLVQFTKHVQEIEEDFWNVRFKAYATWRKKWWLQYQRTGKFTMLTGFECSGLLRKNNVINYPVQGAAFHCLLWCFNRIDYYLYNEGYETRLIGQIHDAIVLDIFPPELERVKQMVKRVMSVELRDAWKWIIVPMDVEMDLGAVDASWADLQPHKI